MSGRREEAKGGTRRCWDTAFTWCAWESPRSPCGHLRRLRSLGARVLGPRRLVGLVSRRRGGPPAHRPSGRGPGCAFASDHAIPTPNPARGGFVCIRQRQPRVSPHVNGAEVKLLTKNQRSAGGVVTGPQLGSLLLSPVDRRELPSVCCLWLRFCCLWLRRRHPQAGGSLRLVSLAPVLVSLAPAERTPVGSCLHRALRQTAGLVFLLVFWVLAGACQRHGVGGFVV